MLGRKDEYRAVSAVGARSQFFAIRKPEIMEFTDIPAKTCSLLRAQPRRTG